MATSMNLSLMGEAALTEFMKKLPAADVEKLMRLYLNLRTQKAAIKKHADAVDAEFKLLMETIENHMLAKADAAGVTGFNIKEVGTSYTAEEKKVSIADDAAFYPFVASLGVDGLEFFERRVAVTFVDKWMQANGGTAPPGLNFFRNRVMRVRKANEK